MTAARRTGARPIHRERDHRTGSASCPWTESPSPASVAGSGARQSSRGVTQLLGDLHDIPRTALAQQLDRARALEQGRRLHQPQCGTRRRHPQCGQPLADPRHDPADAVAIELPDRVSSLLAYTQRQCLALASHRFQVLPGPP